MSELFNNVKVGDTVHYSTPQGQYGKGKVVIKHESGSHVVINRGKGQPQVVNDKNYVKHERGGKVIGALLSKVAAHDKYLKGVASTKASNAVAKAVSPYKKVGDPQMNASKAFGWTKTNEARDDTSDIDDEETPDMDKAYDAASKAGHKVHSLGEPKDGHVRFGSDKGSHKYNLKTGEITKVNEDRRALLSRRGGLPYDWDVEMRKQIFTAGGAPAAAKKTKQKGPPDSGREYKPSKSGPPPRRGTTSEDANDAEGKSARVAKTKKHVKKKLVAESPSSGTLASYVSKAIVDRKKLAGMQDQARRIHTPERAAYFVDKAQKKLDKRSKGIKTAVGKIAGKLPGEKVNEGNPDRYADQSWARELADKSPNMSQGATKKAPGHYLMKGGRSISGPHAPHEAVKAYKDLADSKGVKIVHHTNEGTEIDVTAMLMEASDKYGRATEKAVKLARAKKGNKHVDTEPKLNLPDKGTGGPIEGSHTGERNGTLS